MKRCFFFNIESLCNCSHSETSFLKEVSISSLSVVLFLSNIFRKSSWGKDDTIVKSSFVMETVADATLESCTFCLGDDCFLFVVDGWKGICIADVV